MTDLRRIDVNLILVLDAILAEMNLTRAGEAVGMSQPAVSGALARLRQQFDDPLLIRKGRQFELTPLAESLRPLVAEAMLEIKRTYELLPSFDPATSTRTFHIGATDYLLSQITGPLLQVLEKEAPHVNIEFGTLGFDQLVNVIDLLRRDVTIASAAIGIPGKKQSLFIESFVCIADKNNPAVVDGKLSLEQLAELGHVRMTFGDNQTHHIDEMYTEYGISPHYSISVRGVLMIPHMVAGTNLVGWVQERLAAQMVEPLGLQIVETPVKSPNLTEAVHWHPSKSSDPAIPWLVSMLRRATELLEFGDEPSS
ncbi:MAG: LysR family transcriptional regulator [Actinomycetales bacterium]|nr:LysR family transcriptional regulator [Actinomycetales bacterium]